MAFGKGMKLMNTCVWKNINHLVTYKSGRTETVFDFTLVHCNYPNRVKNVKVIPGMKLLANLVFSLKEVRHKKKFKSRVRLTVEVER